MAKLPPLDRLVTNEVYPAKIESIAGVVARDGRPNPRVGILNDHFGYVRASRHHDPLVREAQDLMREDAYLAFLTGAQDLSLNVLIIGLEGTSPRGPYIL
tara:strand:+ start:2340 stop:2639 length:300 start_codon:yes stop_codon:yes gene_type:complete